MKGSPIHAIVIIAACAAFGFGIGTIAGKLMNAKENKGYIGPSEVVVEEGRMLPETLLSLGRLSDPQLSPDGSKILYGVSYTSIAENKSCRNLFLCDADGGNKVQLTRYAKSVSCARWSADGKSVLFIQDGQIWKAPLRGARLGRRSKLSDVPSGISEFSVSPDEANIMYVSTIPGPVTGPADSDPALSKAQAYVATDLMYRHWDHWVSETPRTFVAPFGGAVITPENSFDILGCEEKFELPTEPFGGIEQLAWAPDSRHIAYSCRKKTGIEYAFSTCTDIFIYDILTGATVALTSGGGYDTDPAWSPDGKSLAWISMERDGYEADRQRLMVVSVEAETPSEGQSFGLSFGEPRELTAGFAYDVAGFRWAGDSKTLYFASTIDAVGALCSLDIESVELKRLTPEDWWVSFGAPFAVKAGKGLTLMTTVNSMDFPAELAVVNCCPDGTAAWHKLSAENDAILSQCDSVRCEKVAMPLANGEILYAWVLYPPHFDAGKQWPGIEMFNGGPQTSLDQSWSFRWNFRLMAQQGYVVVLPARHGDSGFGQEWKEQISGDYQGLNMEDYQVAGRWFKSQPWAGKLGAVGASYGGFSVYNMMGIHGDLYDCFISHAGIFDEKVMWYETEEAWFGNWDNGGLTEYAYEPGQVGPKGDGITFGGMQQAGAPYADVEKSKHHYAFDPSTKVTAWHTPILCIHGMMDFRIPYTQGLAAFNAARMMGVEAKLIVFPEENHWILQPQNALFWHREFFSWLDSHLK